MKIGAILLGIGMIFLILPFKFKINLMIGSLGLVLVGIGIILMLREDG